ncbi:sensor histidine kinase [Nonomuraea rubra]|uniref:sensor histidine kinase n=1 Tax=Nonomuraea rubra TaxID=46180 RepID=UPI0033FA5A96
MAVIAEWRRLLGTQRVLLLDIAVAVVLTLLSSPRTQVHSDTTPWWAFSAIMVIGLLFRHRWPLAAFLLALVGGAAHQLDLYVPPQPIDLIAPITLYSVSAHSRLRRVSYAVLGLAMTTSYVISVANMFRPGVVGGRFSLPGTVTNKAELSTEALAGRAPPDSLPALAALLGEAATAAMGVMFVLVLAFAWGEGVRTRTERLLLARRHAEDLAREQRQRTALATAAERARLAREVHDVVAHGLSVMVAQAQAAVATQRRNPELSAQAMREVVTVGRNSLAEMRQLLGVLRGDSDGADRLPRPDIGQLPALVDRVRAAGTPVTFHLEGTPTGLPASVDLTTYRIVQEALTNTMKHAGHGASADVRLTFEPDRVEIEVTDDGIGMSGPGEGNGLRGIAERVKLLDGELELGRSGEGGVRVHARLPIYAGTPTDRFVLPTSEVTRA